MIFQDFIKNFFKILSKDFIKGFIQRIFSKDLFKGFYQRIFSKDLFKGFFQRIFSKDFFKDFLLIIKTFKNLLLKIITFNL